MRVYAECIASLVLASCMTTVLFILQNPAETQAVDSGIAEYTKEHRQKRSALSTFGVKVLSTILKNAKLLYTNGWDNVFVKSGGVKQAEKDFYTWISPAKAQTTTTKDKTGKIGNVILTLHYESKELTVKFLDIPRDNIIFYKD